MGVYKDPEAVVALDDDVDTYARAITLESELSRLAPHSRERREKEGHLNAHKKRIASMQAKHEIEAGFGIQILSASPMLCGRVLKRYLTDVGLSPDKVDLANLKDSNKFPNIHAEDAPAEDVTLVIHGDQARHAHDDFKAPPDLKDDPAYTKVLNEINQQHFYPEDFV